MNYLMSHVTTHRSVTIAVAFILLSVAHSFPMGFPLTTPSRVGSPVHVNGGECDVVSPSAIWSSSSSSSSSRSSRLYAEGGPPSYAKQMGILRDAEIVGDGSVMLHIERITPTEEKEEEDPDNVPVLPPLDYEPGHVFALEIQKHSNIEDMELDGKTMKDMEQNGGWMRGPYTITRCNTKDSTLDVLIKVVGAKSKAFATAPPGTPIRFGGKFHVPILQGIVSPSSSTSSSSQPRRDTERIVMISTGVGVGPCMGAIEQLLSAPSTSTYRPLAGSIIDLFACYREEDDRLYTDYLNVWSTAYENFRYRPIVTKNIGRLSSSEVNVGLIVNPDICSLTETHYHLVGNGQMVNEWKTGLSQAGVPSDRITVESYFNHKDPPPSKDAIETIASVIREAAIYELSIPQPQ